MKSLKPKREYIFIICHKIGLPPISIIGLGLRCDSSLIRVPSPPASMTTFTKQLPSLVSFLEFLISIPLIRSCNPLNKPDLVSPAQGMNSRGIGQFARGSVRLGGVKGQLAIKSDGLLDHHRSEEQTS